MKNKIWTTLVSLALAGCTLAPVARVHRLNVYEKTQIERQVREMESAAAGVVFHATKQEVK